VFFTLLTAAVAVSTIAVVVVIAPATAKVAHKETQHAKSKRKQARRCDYRE